jgi:hypothetical protein
MKIDVSLVHRQHPSSAAATIPDGEKVFATKIGI